uniref:Retrotransposon Orf1 n=1 Tax=Tanacetum cinerariifolium TaxID=118510 RepID=A0A699HFT9_TANCI|nr:retrotransposon Orf1 [Tanacetum cinerariifolium]
MTREELEKDMYERILILQEPRLIIENLKFSDQHKKLLDSVMLDKLKLDEEVEIKKDEATKEVVRGYKTLREMNSLRVFVLPIHIEGNYNTHSLAGTSLNINVLPYGIYAKIGRGDVKLLANKITMLDLLKAEPMGILRDVLCQVGISTILARFLILDMHVDKDKFYVDAVKNKQEEKDSEKTVITKRNTQPILKDLGMEKMVAILGSLPVALQRNEWIPSYADNFIKSWNTRRRSWFFPTKIYPQHETVEEAMLLRVYHELLLWGTSNKAAKSKYNTNLARLLPKQINSLVIVDWEVLNNMGCAEEIKEILEIKVYKVGGQKEIFSSKEWRSIFNINEPIYTELCHEFYSTYEFDEVVMDDELITKKLIKFRLGGHRHTLTLLEFARRLRLYHSVEINEAGFELIMQILKKIGLLTDEVLNSLSALTYCRALDATTIRELIAYNGRLIVEGPAPGVPRVAMPRGPLLSVQDLYDHMGNMKVR